MMTALMVREEMGKTDKQSDRHTCTRHAKHNNINKYTTSHYNIVPVTQWTSTTDSAVVNAMHNTLSVNCSIIVLKQKNTRTKDITFKVIQGYQNCWPYMTSYYWSIVITFLSGTICHLLLEVGSNNLSLLH